MDRADDGGPFDPRDRPIPELIARAEAVGAPAEAPRRLLSAILQHGEHDPAAWNRRFHVPRRLVADWPPLPRLALERVETSAADGFQKLLFRTADAMAVETVLIPLHKPGAVSVCLSSQVGCPMACAFCATARMESRRNLATWEIVDQWVQARDLARSQGRRVTGTVFMGMGEPFLNYDRVMRAGDLLRCPFGGALSAKAMTVSTVGLVPEIDRFTRERRTMRLSISLGAATDEKRAMLVPVASRTPVAEVMAAARRHAEARRQRVMLSYVCIDGLNVGEDDAEAIGRLVGDTPVRFDLIDVTDPTGRFRPPSAEALAAFRDALTRHLGQPVVRRYSGGADIQAACGTLAGTG
ncbi:23S rRNA (adenine(2503)-C(2))-methyltransferase RlmN [Tautonia sociabilis]|uniref:Radical SAM protein n=1 Tax=Tautonia sociabilis TaxID=2080755 RepID=A0A432MM53_9BACT|nr:radical SAM protein [Tautonia sociabilis]RUL88524.1 radical SAM protein [Tautonia sociabilis]